MTSDDDDETPDQPSDAELTDADADADIEADIEADTDADIEADTDSDADGDGAPPIWVPFADEEEEPAARPAVASRSDRERSAAPAEPKAPVPLPMLAGAAALVLLAAAAVFGLIASRGPGSDPQSPPRSAASKQSAAKPGAAKPSPAPSVLPTTTCTYAPTREGSVPRRAAAPPAAGVVRGGQVAVQLTTNKGQLVLSLNRSRTPCTVNSFLGLAGQSFFDGTPCHRVTTQGIYVLQCGDPGGTGTGGPGYSFADENLPSKRTAAVTYKAGTVAMANGGPNTNGSQFFIVYADTRLLPTWTIFGQVTAGLDVVQSIAAVGSQPAADGKPKQPVTITSVELVPPTR